LQKVFLPAANCPLPTDLEHEQHTFTEHWFPAIRCNIFFRSSKNISAAIQARLSRKTLLGFYRLYLKKYYKNCIAATPISHTRFV
jgi:hypothetical protein